MPPSGRGLSLSLLPLIPVMWVMTWTRWHWGPFRGRQPVWDSPDGNNNNTASTTLSDVLAFYRVVQKRFMYDTSFWDLGNSSVNEYCYMSVAGENLSYQKEMQQNLIVESLEQLSRSGLSGCLETDVPVCDFYSLCPQVSLFASKSYIFLFCSIQLLP